MLKQYLKLSFQKKGFSLIEVLVSVAILGVLSAVSVGTYRKYLRSAYKTTSKVQLSEIAKTLDYVHSVDGGYHSRIYTGGYRIPNEFKQKSWGGFRARPSKITCDIFPTKANINTQHQNYFTIGPGAYKAGTTDYVQNTRQVCGAQPTSCDRNSLGVWSLGSGVTEFQSAMGSKTNIPSACTDLVKTDRDQYSYTCETYLFAVVSKTPVKKYFLTTDQTGVICAGEEDEGWAVQK